MGFTGRAIRADVDSLRSQVARAPTLRAGNGCPGGGPHYSASIIAALAHLRPSRVCLQQP